jgi:hypothetical protein
MQIKLNNFSIGYFTIIDYINSKYDNRIRLYVDSPDDECIELWFTKNVDTIIDYKLYIIEEKIDTYNTNILSMYQYFKILNCNVNNLNGVQLSYLANVIYNFILLNTSIKKLYPLVLDVISSVDYLIHNKVSLARFGDGEIGILYGTRAPYNEVADRFIDTYNSILSCNTSMSCFMLGLVDVFYENSANHWVQGEAKYWFTKNKWRNKILKVISPDYQNTIYLCSNISRNHHYLGLNTERYFEYFSEIFINKSIVVVANRERFFNSLLPIIIFPAKSIIFIECKDNRCSDEESEIYAKCVLYGKDKLIMAFAGLLATKLAYRLSLLDGYQSIDAGSFSHIKSTYNNEYLCKIENITYLYNYTILDGCSHIPSVDNIIDDSVPLKFTNYSKIHFNLPEYLYQFDMVFCKISIKVNRRSALMTGYSYIEFDTEYSGTILFDFKQCRDNNKLWYKFYIHPLFDGEWIINKFCLGIIKICE